MQKGPVSRFFIRWFVCGLGLWIAAGLLGERINYDSRIGVIILAGLILALVNAIIKPIVVILSLPAILFSLGLFMIVINGFMVYLVGWLYPQLEIASFGTAMVAGLVIGLVNYLVSTILEER
ncbi:MAG TPA: phage holin family protein [Verrucomicrobiae bacterium]|nr:phage holin family protein [Verrucomicrobiae bacterium]